MVVSMLQMLSYMYSSHYSIIKFVGFKMIYYAISLGVVSYSIVFSDLIPMLLLIYCYFESIKLFLKKKKNLQNIFPFKYDSSGKEGRCTRGSRLESL